MNLKIRENYQFIGRLSDHLLYSCFSDPTCPFGQQNELFCYYETDTVTFKDAASTCSKMGFNLWHPSEPFFKPKSEEPMWVLVSEEKTNTTDINESGSKLSQYLSTSLVLI